MTIECEGVSQTSDRTIENIRTGHDSAKIRRKVSTLLEQVAIGPDSPWWNPAVVYLCAWIAATLDPAVLAGLTGVEVTAVAGYVAAMRTNGIIVGDRVQAAWLPHYSEAALKCDIECAAGIMRREPIWRDGFFLYSTIDCYGRP